MSFPYPSIVQQKSYGRAISGLDDQLSVLNRTDGSGPWVTVGTVGVDGVDALIQANPVPWNAPPYIPFQNSWTDVPARPPVQFKRFQNWVHIRGAVAGGSPASVIFTLPTGFLPEAEETILGAIDGGGSFWTCFITLSGDVTFVS